MTANLRVGLIGVNADRGWARLAHVPAIARLAGLELAAVATRRQESADAAAEAFGAARAYGEPAALIGDPDVDVVSVATTVPSHHGLILAALRAGKHVVTEWPVAMTATETEEIARLADETGRRVAVGLQGRMHPASVAARRMIVRGDIGRILYATTHSAVAGFGPVVDESSRYLEDPDVGMNLPTIVAGHTLDLATLLAGELVSFTALTTIQYPTLTVAESSKTLQRSIPDHVLVHGRLSGGGALAAEMVGGRPPAEAVFRLEVVGEGGTIAVSGGGPVGFQAAPLRLAVDGEAVDVDAGELTVLPAEAMNTAAVYAALRDDLRDGTRIAPDARDAVRLAHLVDGVVASAQDGR
jgi:predicted dehydrogenase